MTSYYIWFDYQRFYSAAHGRNKITPRLHQQIMYSMYYECKPGRGEFAGAGLVVVAGAWNFFPRCALFCYVAHFVNSPLIGLIISASAKLSLELDNSGYSKTGGRVNMLASDPTHPTLPVAGGSRVV